MTVLAMSWIFVLCLPSLNKGDLERVLRRWFCARTLSSLEVVATLQSMIKTLFWNIQGVPNPMSQHELAMLCRTYCLDLVAIFERWRILEIFVIVFGVDCIWIMFAVRFHGLPFKNCGFLPGILWTIYLLFLVLSNKSVYSMLC